MTYDSRFLLGIIQDCTRIHHELRLIAKKFPHLRPKTCYLSEVLVQTVLDAEKLREKMEL